MQNRIEDITKKLTVLSEELYATREAKLSSKLGADFLKFRESQLLRKRDRLVEELKDILNMKAYWVGGEGLQNKILAGLTELEIRTIYSFIPGVDMSKLRIIELKPENFTY